MNDANRNTALPDENQSGVMNEPQIGAGSNDAPRIASANLSDTEESAGLIGRPVVASSDLTATGSYQMNPSGDLNNGASDENRSAKFKAPNVSQDVPPLEVEARKPE